MPTQLQALPSVLRILLMASPLGVLACIFRWWSGCHIHPKLGSTSVSDSTISLPRAKVYLCFPVPWFWVDHSLSNDPSNGQTWESLSFITIEHLFSFVHPLEGRSHLWVPSFLESWAMHSFQGKPSLFNYRSFPFWTSFELCSSWLWYLRWAWSCPPKIFTKLSLGFS